MIVFITGVFWFELFLNARAEILKKISLGFWSKRLHQKVLLKLIDLYIHFIKAKQFQEPPNNVQKVEWKNPEPKFPGFQGATLQKSQKMWLINYFYVNMKISAQLWVTSTRVSIKVEFAKNPKKIRNPARKIPLKCK